MSEGNRPQLKCIDIHRRQRFERKLVLEKGQVAVQDAAGWEESEFLEGAEISVTQHRHGGHLLALRYGLRKKLGDKFGTLLALKLVPQNILDDQAPRAGGIENRDEIAGQNTAARIACGVREYGARAAK